MVARIGGLALILMGAMLGLVAAALGLTLMGRPVPADWPFVREVMPAIAQIAAGAGVPPGAGPADLLRSPFGLMAWGGVAAGGWFAVLGLWQLVTGRFARGAVVVGMLIIGGVGLAVGLMP